jgi:hypothetical protein
MLRATPQLSAQPCSSSGLLFEHSRDSPGDTRLPAGVCTLDPYSRAVPTSATFELSRVTSRGPPSGPRAATMASQLCISRDSVVSLASLHPCQQAAHFLVHTRPPDHCGPFRLRRPRRNPGALHRQFRHQRAFVTTRSGLDTMPRNDDIEEGAAQGAPRRLGTVPRAVLLTPPAAPADLRAALATIPAEWGRRMFDPASLDTRMAACKLTVKHPEDLLVLRQALFDDLCPPITWILRTSVLEWEYLSAEQKQQQTEMREAWLSGYSKPSDAILQHWLWKFLKDRTRQFAHLHKVFTNIPSNTPQCGTAAWTQIFFHYPLSGAVLAHKLLARGLKACLKFKDDSSAAGCAYIESVNTSVSQLSNLPHLSVPDVFALVSLMGLYLSDAHGHQKAYKDLIAFIDEGNELTLDKVQNTVIYHSRDTSLRAFALTHAGASPSCNHRCPRCCDPRGTTPRPSRSSSRAGGRSGSPSAPTHSLRGFVFPFFFCSLWERTGTFYVEGC